MKKIIIAFTVIVILVGVVFFFFKTSFIKITTNIEQQKANYNIGDNIAIETTITNYAPWSYKKTFSSTFTYPIIAVEGVDFSPSFGVLAGFAMTDVVIKPFDSIIYSNSLNLVTMKEIGIYSGNRDLVVQPGSNTIEFTWGKTGKLNIYVNPDSFSDTPLGCDEFKSQDRKNDCYSENTDNIQDCLKITEDLKKDFCLDRIIGEIEDYEYCEKIVNHSIKQRCLETAGEKTKDPKYCDKLTKQAEEGFCSLFRKIER